MSESRSSSPPDLPALSARAVDSWSSIPDEQRLRAMLGATCDIVWETPQDGELHGAQPGWSAFTGQPADAYLGKGWLNAVHPDDRAIVAGPWSAALAGRPFFEAQYRLRHADGGYRHMTLRAMPLAASDGSGGNGGWVGAHTDISERKRAEERLRLAMKGGMGTWDLDLGSGLMSCSDACKANFGRASGERLDYDDMLASIAEPDLPRWRDTLHRAIALGRDFDIECRLCWPDQSLHWTQLRGSCTFDAAGGVIGMSGISLDLTASKRSEQVLQDTLARHDATMAAGEVATWTWDIVADTVIADRNMNRLFLGRDGETGSAPLQLFLDAIHPDDIERVQHEIEQAIGQGTAYETTYRVRSPSGENEGEGDAGYRSVIARGRAEYSAEGAPLRLPGVILDVTRQRQVEERLHSSEERYRHLVELMDQAFCEIEVLFDADGNACDYRYLEVNSSFIEQSGLPDAVGKTILEMVPGHEIYWARLYGQVAASGVAVRVESEARAMNRWFDIYAARVGGPGSCRVAILFTDITERKRSEQQLRLLADNLSEMDRRKTEFLATLAHELRNPLAPIRNGLQIMRMAADNPATVARVRDVMERQVNQMVHLVNDLLDVARITRGQIELKTERVDLKTIVAGAVETSLPLIDTNRHALAIDIGEAALPLEADPTRLAQVLANLLNNAAKYTPPGGRIGITARRSDDGDGDVVVITISDSGVGIPQESLDSVFDMFTQVGENMHRAQGGLGIGLSLVRRLVELHGGSVSASSDGAGLGSTFSVRLPLALDADASAAIDTAGVPAAPQAHTGRKLRVLVVDDNLDAADTLADLLGMLGHATRIAHDGPQALLAAGEFLPELVFLDIGLPGISGYDVARALRQDQRFSATVLAALTGWGAADDRSQSSAAGFDHHLTKPANLDTIKQLLASLGASATG